MTETVDVVVVGLGPTGATLANLCGQLGLRMLVVERSEQPYPQPRACHLDAEIARVLQDLGFEAQLHELLTVSAGMEAMGCSLSSLWRPTRLLSMWWPGLENSTVSTRA